MALVPIRYVDPQAASVTTDAGPHPYPPSVPSVQVDLIEAVGASQDEAVVTNSVHLLSMDTHSLPDMSDYALHPLRGAGTQYSYERWIRLRFTPPFSNVRAFRFWVPGYAPTTGWTLKFGTTSTYATPVATASAIATGSMPTTDPGQLSPNAGGATRLSGTGVQHSDWIVLQASVNTATASVGSVQGFSVASALIPITYQITWIET